MSTANEQEAESTRGADKRLRSTIKFPYGDLDDAVEIAHGVQHWGHTCAVDQLAAQLGQTSSGGFRTKLTSASTFGIVKVAQKQVGLTDVGKRLIDPKTKDRALVDAFLTVPLFDRLYETFKGTLLPSDAGLEQEMVRAGVSAKIVPKARQAFQRSAQQAGFFRSGRDRLVVPPVSRIAASDLEPKSSPTGSIVEHAALKQQQEPTIMLQIVRRTPAASVAITVSVPLPTRDVLAFVAAVEITGVEDMAAEVLTDWARRKARNSAVAAGTEAIANARGASVSG